MRFSVIYFIETLVFGSCIVHAELLVSPQNTEVVDGGNAVFNCTTSDQHSINWQHIPLGSTKPLDVYTSRLFIYPYSVRYKIVGNQTFGQYNLVITNASLEDAGIFICADKAGQGSVQRAELIFLETFPTCEPNFNSSAIVGENDCGIQPNILRFTCNVKYRGNVAPQLNFNLLGNKSVMTMASSMVNLPNQVTQEVAVIPTVDVDGRSFVCETSLRKYRWISENLTVLTIFNSSEIKTVSQKVTEKCIPNSNHLASVNCSYRWTKITGNGEEDVSSIQSLTISKRGLYSCLAEFTLRKQSCAFQVTRIYFDDDNGDYKLLLGLLIFETIIVFILITSLCVMKRTYHQKFKNHFRNHFDRPTSYGHAG